jgi:hypothetical protein
MAENEWQKHLKKTREENKDIPMKEVFKKAKETYKKNK